jgi:hypothetical protein
MARFRFARERKIIFHKPTYRDKSHWGGLDSFRLADKLPSESLRFGLSPRGPSTATSGPCLPYPVRLLLLWFSCKSSLELRDQSRHGLRLFIRDEVTAGQPLNLETEVAQSFLREIDLPAAAHQERELIAIRLEEVTEVKPIALRFVIGHEARSRSEVEQAIVAVHRAMELEDFGVEYVIAFGPHLPYSWHPLEQREGSAHAPAGTVGEAAQHRSGVPRMGMPVREEPAIKDENPAYVGAAHGFGPL